MSPRVKVKHKLTLMIHVWLCIIGCKPSEPPTPQPAARPTPALDYDDCSVIQIAKGPPECSYTIGQTFIEGTEFVSNLGGMTVPCGKSDEACGRTYHCHCPDTGP